ncbi:MAG: hypothetical protein ABJN11_10505 [Lentilitoribacter sp.]
MTKHRDTSWFFEAESCGSGTLGDLKLPAYVNLHFELCRQDFNLSEDDHLNRMCHLVYLISETNGNWVSGIAENDLNVLRILDEDQNFESGLNTSFPIPNYIYFYLKWKPRLLEQLNCHELKGNECRVLRWFYTWGLLALKPVYVKSSLHKYLVPSQRLTTETLEITKLFELVFETSDFQHMNDLNLIERDRSTKYKFAIILFDYSQYRYTLSDRQLDQLCNFSDNGTSNILSLYDIYNEINLREGEHLSLENIASFSNLDISPQILSRITELKENSQL